MKEQAAAKWNECLVLIKKKLGNETEFSTWFQPTEAKSLRGSHLTLTLPSGFCQELYDTKYSGLLVEALSAVLGPEFKLSYEVPIVKDVKGGSLKYEGVTAKDREDKNPDPFMPQLNSALSFDNYCVGQCNKLPWTIAESIARNPVNSNFNPFFLYGDVGVGKTHLMQAIGIQVKKAFPDKRVVFLPMREFQRLYQNAYLRKEIPAFLSWFNRCDVLLFDDLQEIVGSEGTLNNALFPIFNHLHLHGKQLVFTCDRAPQDLKGLEERLIDRFKWGIIEKLEKPDAALRKKILTFKARKNGLDLPQDVIEYISGTPLNSVREIEGIVLGIMTRAINLGLEIDINLAKEVLKRSSRAAEKRNVNFEMIVEATAEKFDLNSDVIFSKSRVKDVADARMVIMYLAHTLMKLTPAAIGRKIGRKHSTVIHGINTVMERLGEDPEFKSLVASIKKDL